MTEGLQITLRKKLTKTSKIAVIFEVFVSEWRFTLVYVEFILVFVCVCVYQSARDLSQLSDLQAQLEEVAKEKQEIQEKVFKRTVAVSCPCTPLWLDHSFSIISFQYYWKKIFSCFIFAAQFPSEWLELAMIQSCEEIVIQAPRTRTESKVILLTALFHALLWI